MADWPDPPSPVQFFIMLFPTTCQRITKVYCWIETKARGLHRSIRHPTFAILVPLGLSMFGPIGIYVGGVIGAIATFACLATTRSLRQYSIFYRFMISVVLNLSFWGVLGYLAYKYSPQVPQVEEIADAVARRLENREVKEPKPNPPPTIQAKEETKSEPPEPTSQRANSQPQLILIFKDSPLFTSTRKERIRNEMESFYEYLVMVGFDPPKEVPPLGTGEMAASGRIIPGPVYWSHISINVKQIDDPRAIVGAYARFAFGTMLHAGDPNWRDYGKRTTASLILSEYFAASFLGQTPKIISTGSFRWVNAIWVIRQKFGREFTDTTMLFTLKSFNDRATEDIRMSKNTMSEDEFNESFASHFLFGESVVDNNRAKYEQITRMLRDNGLLK